MASMLLSTMSMFLSDGGMFLLILILAAFFLFFIDPYDWKKKWKNRTAGRSKEGRGTKAIRSSELEKLKALKNAGLLSEEEYREREREINSI